MDRRLFLTSLGSLLAGATLDPERLLWKPGKLISIPKPRFMWRMVNTSAVDVILSPVSLSICYDQRDQPSGFRRLKAGDVAYLDYVPEDYTPTVQVGPLAEPPFLYAYSLLANERGHRVG